MGWAICAGWEFAADNREVRSYGAPMQLLRAWILSNRHLAVVLLVLTLCVRALTPAGYMVSASDERVLTVSICADATGSMRQLQMVVPDKGTAGSHSGKAQADGQCAFSSLAHAALGGADPLLLALALAFILVLGIRNTARLPMAQIAFLRPPLRGPPAIA